MSGEPLFEEVQYPAWPFMLIGIGGSALGGWGAAAARGALAGVAGAVALGVGATAVAGAFLVPMRTRVEPHRIEVRFGRFTRFRIPFDAITGAEAVTYHPVREYGGWGIRLGIGGRAYNMRGNHGVQLLLRDGGRLLIGSQRASELAETIRHARGLRGPWEAAR